MFCDQCGAELLAEQQYCSRCGKQVVAGVGFTATRSRVQQHIRLLAILWMALSCLNAVGGVVLVVLANTLFARLSQFHPDFPGFLQPLLTVVGIFVLAKAAFGFLAGWGLLQRESWARMLALVLGFLSLFNMPFGTALGIYTLWVLLPARADFEYEELRRAA